LRLILDLRFEIEGIYLGIDLVVINDRNQADGLVREVLIFDGSLWRRATAPTWTTASTLPTRP
jgi:hypothetical protein